MIEELDDPSEGPSGTRPSFDRRSVTRGQLTAALAGVLVGVMVVAAMPPLAQGGVVRASAVPTPEVAAGGGLAVRATPSGCRAQPTVTSTPGPAFVALADQGDRGIAFLLSATTGAHRGRIDVAGSPQAALDTLGGQLLVICAEAGASQLVSYDLGTLQERWRTPIVDRQITKAPGDIPALAVSPDGSRAFVLHYRALRADANAPGGSLNWLTVHDARAGAALVDVELPECGVGSVHAGASAVFVLCRDGVRVIDTRSWQVTRTHAMPATLRPVGMVDGTRLFGVTRELRVIGVDLGSGTVVEDSAWGEGTRATANAWGRLAIAADGCCLWVLAKGDGDPSEFGPDFLTYIDLEQRKRIDMPTPNVRGVGVVGPHLVYIADGRLHSTGGSLDTMLLAEPVAFWQILGPTPLNEPPRAGTHMRMGCQSTTTRDASGVITIDGNVGIVGNTFTPSGDGSFLVVRRGAKSGDTVSLEFRQIGATAPATWVQYSATASPQQSKTPWGDAVAFPAGWKPIAFAGSCWRLIVDGTDSGLVLAVGP
jgi:hypothetical protein